MSRVSWSGLKTGLRSRTVCAGHAGEDPQHNKIGSLKVDMSGAPAPSSFTMWSRTSDRNLVDANAQHRGRFVFGILDLGGFRHDHSVRCLTYVQFYEIRASRPISGVLRRRVLPDGPKRGVLAIPATRVL